ncbi:MAG: zf-HC2 domain-containing protein [Ruminococcaceae bacterium]|nr:zf-HC2 domain-containing protein [Oscillospiraceae bacterium]
MSKINCSLIKDLLPLYIDDLCSKETTEIVGNHLEICEDCNKEYETLKTEPKVKPQQDNSQELIKKVNKKFGKDKKKAVIKTISIVLVVVIIIGIVAFLKIPLYLADNYFLDNGFSYMVSNYENWETHNTGKSNYENKIAKLYINEKYGEYKEEAHQFGINLIFEDGKKIIMFDTPVDLEGLPDFDEDFINGGYYSYEKFPILHPFIKRGLENMGIDTSLPVGIDDSVYLKLITRDIPIVKFFCSFDEYCDMCAYYGLYMIMMPTGQGNSYYMVDETEDMIAWGWSGIGEEYNLYSMHFQTKGDYSENKTLTVLGFTKEEAKEIFKYAVIK